MNPSGTAMVTGESARRLALCAVVALFCLVEQACAQTGGQGNRFRDWHVFHQGSGADRICWVSSQPLRATASRANVRRGEILITVAHRPGHGVENEVSVTGGYPYKPGSDVTISIGGRRFSFFTEKEHAWSLSPALDDRIVAAMRRGQTAIAKGISSRGTRTEDTFSLLGFTAALKRAKALCRR